MNGILVHVTLSYRSIALDNNEAIVFTPPFDLYNHYLIYALSYAVASVPFTFNRFDKPVEKRIENIAKGKLCEILFVLFAELNKIPISTGSCNTPYWRKDKKDFMINGTVWDTKMLDIFSPDPVLKIHPYTSLPSAIPHGKSSQWDKRCPTIFTFMKWQGLWTLNLSSKQAKFLEDRCKKYKGTDHYFEPDSFKEVKDELTRLRTKDQNAFFTRLAKDKLPPLVICSYATSDHWDKFKFVEASTQPISYPLNKRPPAFYMKQDNMVALSGELPSVLTLFPHLQSNLNHAMTLDEYIGKFL